MTKKLSECPYCKRPADEHGGINHVGGCTALQDVPMNRLQYDILRGNLSLAEEGLANYALEVEGLKHELEVQKGVVDMAYIPHRHLVEQRDRADHDFKNFHRLLCERFGYGHDEHDWYRDQLSLIEWIAKRHSSEPLLGALTNREMQTQMGIYTLLAADHRAGNHAAPVEGCPECVADGIDRQHEPSERRPDGYAYRYHDYRGDVIRFNGGEPVNGSTPFESVPYYFGSPSKSGEQQ